MGYSFVIEYCIFNFMVSLSSTQVHLGKTQILNALCFGTSSDKSSIQI